MNDLFNEYQNQLVQKLYQLLLDMKENKTFTRDELNFSTPFHPKLASLVDSLQTLFFKKDSKNEQVFRPLYNFHLPPHIPAKAELQWLKEMNEDPAFSFLLTPELHQKLDTALQDVTVLRKEDYCEMDIPFGDCPEKEPLHTILFQFHQALLHNQKIQFALKNHSPQVGIPFRLEYNLAVNRFSCWIAYGPMSSFHRVAASDIKTIQLLSDTVPDLTDAFKTFLDDHERELKLQIKPKYNTVVRCFLLFASYKKEGIYYDAKNEYHLKVTYYDFDETDIIENIISLGSAVTVLSPKPLQTKIIQRLKQMWLLYQ